MKKQIVHVVIKMISGIIEDVSAHQTEAEAYASYRSYCLSIDDNLEDYIPEQIPGDPEEVETLLQRVRDWIGPDDEVQWHEPEMIVGEVAAEPVQDVNGEDEDYPREDWHYEVANGDTNRGYWDWVEAKKEQDEAENSLNLGEEDDE